MNRAARPRPIKRTLEKVQSDVAGQHTYWGRHGKVLVVPGSIAAERLERSGDMIRRRQAWVSPLLPGHHFRRRRDALAHCAKGTSPRMLPVLVDLPDPRVG